MGEIISHQAVCIRQVQYRAEIGIRPANDAQAAPPVLRASRAGPRFYFDALPEDEAANHDDAYNTFMTLPRYTRTREDEVQPLVEGALRHSPPAWSLVEHRERVDL